MSALTDIFTDIANSLRSKMGVADTFKPDQMAPAINNIETAHIDEYKYLTNNGVIEYVATLQLTDNKKVVQYDEAAEINRWDRADATELFFQATFDSNVNMVCFGDKVEDMSSTFMQAYEFNKPISIGNNVTNMQYCFDQCNTFNQPVNIPDSVTNMVFTFNRCSNFNSPVTIGNNVTNMRGCFEYCDNFNQPITIPNSVINMVNAFHNCVNFNAPIVIGSNVKNLANAFFNCQKFNQPVSIPDIISTSSTTYALENTFYNCREFNSPVMIGNVNYLYSTFRFCSNFNQPIAIPNSVYGLHETFRGCVSFNQPIVIPGNVNYIQNAFYQCSNLSQPIYFVDSNKIKSEKNAAGMLGGISKYIMANLGIRIYCNDARPFLGTKSNNSIVSSDITWSSRTNEYYNTSYNISIFNNWSPA